MSEIYRQNPKVEAIILAGSVARKLEDEHSDIELHILWSMPPEDDDRKGPIHRIDGTILSYYPYEEAEWFESYLTKDGIKLEISNFLSVTVETFISDVVGQCDISYEKQCIVSSVHDGVSLYGGEIVNELKDRVVAYPLDLSKRMISENLLLSNCWHNREVFLKRKDWLMLYDVICEVERNIFCVLFGFNGMYVHHLAFKWMPFNVDRMSFKPANLYERMANALIGKPEYCVQELEVLIQEVLQLVEHHAPELHIAEQQKRMQYAK
ncbi:cytoplasmic protein [Bacillus anthracis]|nr:cytoplasmic protein [Bacillus anthracis]